MRSKLLLSLGILKCLAVLLKYKYFMSTAYVIHLWWEANQAMTMKNGAAWHISQVLDDRRRVETDSEAGRTK